MLIPNEHCAEWEQELEQLRLEEQWDANVSSGSHADRDSETVDEMPDPDQAVRGIEEFLKQEREQDSAPGSSE